jgi:YjzC-like protein
MDQFKPGDQAPKSGIYDVVHDGVHQDQHQVTMVKGETFPPCRQCGDHPRFSLALHAHHAPNHEHFKK